MTMADPSALSYRAKRIYFQTSRTAMGAGPWLPHTLHRAKARRLARDPSHLDWARHYNALYSRVPKTGSTSLVAALGCEPEHHFTLGAYRYIDRELTDNAIKFLTVRNPWDRFVSAFFYGDRRAKDDQFHFSIHREADGFDGFVDALTRPLGKRFMRADLHTQPQWIYLHPYRIEDDKVFTLRYETLAEDFRALCGVLGIETELPHLNRSERADYRHYYTDDTAELVGRMYARDIELFGYTFDGLKP